MADKTAAAGGPATDTAEPQDLTFKIKATGDKVHEVTMSDGATVLDLKTKMAGEEFENVPPERQRLIYSGRVMKNDDKLSTYKIKPGNTVHLVKSAASNPAPRPGASSGPTQPAIPSNMAAGTNNDLLSGLTGARFAGLANLPNASIFGADGGMGAPPNVESLAQMLEDPAIHQTILAALDNPQIIDAMINQNAMLRNMPGARQMLQSPMLRQFLTNPDMMRMAARMSDQAGNRGGASFPAPGPANPSGDGNAGAAAGGNRGGAGGGAGTGQQQMPFGFPFMPGLFPPRPADGNANNPGDNNNNNNNPSGQAPQNPFAALGGGQPSDQNPFLALFGNPAAGPGATGTGTGGGGGGANPGQMPNPFAMPPPDDAAIRSMLEGIMRGMGTGGEGGVPPAAAPVDSRPPEERYEQQLRQLNEMGFHDFDRNVAALRRSGGDVTGAVVFLLEH